MYPDFCARLNTVIPLRRGSDVDISARLLGSCCSRLVHRVQSGQRSERRGDCRYAEALRAAHAEGQSRPEPRARVAARQASARP